MPPRSRDCPSPIRLLHVLEATTGGTRKHLRLLLQQLDRSRFQVDLAYANERDPHFADDLKDFEESGIRCIEIPMRREIAPVSDSLAFAKIARLMRKNRYDIVHAHSSKAGFLARLAARAAGVGAVLYTPHSFAFQHAPERVSSRLYLLLERFAARFHDRLVCVSPSEAEVAREHGLCSQESHIVIPNTIARDSIHPVQTREEARRELGLPEGSPVVGTVAQFRPQKGLGTFVEAAARVIKERPDVRFLMVGDGPLLPAIREKARRLAVGDQIVFTGHRESVADCYRAMDVFALSSLWKGMPYVVLEAMASGIPVVATRVVGTEDLIDDGRTGLLVPPSDPRAMAAGICSLLVDPGLGRSLVQRASEAFEERLTMDEWIDHYENLYEELLKKN